MTITTFKEMKEENDLIKRHLLFRKFSSKPGRRTTYLSSYLLSLALSQTEGTHSTPMKEDMHEG